MRLLLWTVLVCWYTVCHSLNGPSECRTELSVDWIDGEVLHELCTFTPYRHINLLLTCKDQKRLNCFQKATPIVLDVCRGHMPSTVPVAISSTDQYSEGLSVELSLVVHGDDDVEELDVFQIHSNQQSSTQTTRIELIGSYRNTRIQMALHRTCSDSSGMVFHRSKRDEQQVEAIRVSERGAGFSGREEIIFSGEGEQVPVSLDDIVKDSLHRLRKEMEDVSKTGSEKLSKAYDYMHGISTSSTIEGRNITYVGTEKHSIKNSDVPNSHTMTVNDLTTALASTSSSLGPNTERITLSTPLKTTIWKHDPTTTERSTAHQSAVLTTKQVKQTLPEPTTGHVSRTRPLHPSIDLSKIKPISQEVVGDVLSKEFADEPFVAEADEDVPRVVEEINDQDFLDKLMDSLRNKADVNPVSGPRTAVAFSRPNVPTTPVVKPTRRTTTSLSPVPSSFTTSATPPPIQSAISTSGRVSSDRATPTPSLATPPVTTTFIKTTKMPVLKSLNKQSNPDTDVPTRSSSTLSLSSVVQGHSENVTLNPRAGVPTGNRGSELSVTTSPDVPRPLPTRTSDGLSVLSTKVNMTASTPNTRTMPTSTPNTQTNEKPSTLRTSSVKSNRGTTTTHPSTEKESFITNSSEFQNTTPQAGPDKSSIGSVTDQVSIGSSTDDGKRSIQNNQRNTNKDTSNDGDVTKKSITPTLLETDSTSTTDTVTPTTRVTSTPTNEPDMSTSSSASTSTTTISTTGETTSSATISKSSDTAPTTTMSTSTEKTSSTTINTSSDTPSSTAISTSSDTTSTTVTTTNSPKTSPKQTSTDKIPAVTTVSELDLLPGQTPGPLLATSSESKSGPVSGGGDNDDTFWPVVAALVIGIPSVIVFGIAITVIHKRRKIDTSRAFYLGGHHHRHSIDV